MMIPYKNIHRLSSILAYELGDESIRIEFVSGAVREYTYANVGRDHVEAMKKCATKGKGLGSYVMKNERHFIALREMRAAQKNT
ncbi:hypothetical protein [Chlorobaculum limnaeum]|nr:hypothetical protein [Chlorobaculum limnaeum]